MTDETLQVAINEATRFLKKAKDCKMKFHESALARICGCPESSAVKRSSMDLSRTLSDLRQGR